MASNKLLDPIFTLGDDVVIKDAAPKRYKPGAKGCICGIRTIDSPKISLEFGAPIESELYLIEFSDGISIEIPKIFLSLLS